MLNMRSCSLAWTSQSQNAGQKSKPWWKFLALMNTSASSMYAIYATIPRLSAKSCKAAGDLIPSSRNDSENEVRPPNVLVISA